MNKQYIDLNDIDVNEEIDFEFINEKGRESVEHTLNTTDVATEKRKSKYIRKTIYINRDYLDVLEFFERKDSSAAICELIREQLRKEKGEEAKIDLASIMQAIHDLHNKHG